MKLIAQKDIDREKWDALVLSQEDTLLYNQSIFLDNLSENWMLFTNDDYSFGMPLPFTLRLGIKGLYTPNFIRAVDWVGDRSVVTDDFLKQLEALLRKEFKHASLRLENDFLMGSKEDRVYQMLSEKTGLNEQAKRSLKKFEKSELAFTEVDLEDISPIIIQELREKVIDLNKQDFVRFTKLLENYPNENYWLVGVRDSKEIVGGMIFIKWQNTLHYVKGGALEHAKKSGAMYAMMFKAIEYAQNEGLVLDFGGSNVEGVRRFNLAFGAEDKSYYHWSFDQTPWWFKIARRLKNGSKSSN